MKKRRNNSRRASTLRIALPTGLISISAILLAIAPPAKTEKAPRHDLSGFQLKEDTDASTTLGNYPDTLILLSTDTTVTPDAAPSNTMSINVSTDANFNGNLEGDPTTGLVRITDAHPAGTYTVTVTALNGGGATATKTFALTVTTPATCPQVTFETSGIFSVDYYPRSVAVGDFNGDGKQDLATAGDFSVSILLGDGTGHFSAATNFTTGDSYSVAVGDFNGDGKQDLVTANYQDVSILLGDGAGNFSAAAHLNAGGGLVSVAVGDFNGDGKQDLAVAKTDSSATVAILLGDGTGHFSAATYFGPGGNFVSIAVGDFNADGKQDLAVASESSNNNVSIFLGDGTGHFSAPTNFSAGSDPSSVAVGDFNADGKQDLAVANYYSGNVSILLGDGTGHFSAPTNFVAGGGPRAVAVGDFNGDGKQDLAFANSVSNNASSILGDGTGRFGAPIYYAVGTNGGNPSSVAVGDFNADGKQDLAVSSFNYASEDVTILLRNCALPTATPTPSGTPTTTTHFQVTADQYVYQGFSFYLQVIAKDQFNTTVTGYPGTVHFTSTALAYLPPDCPLPNGTGVFMPTLNTLGYQTITATDTSDPSIAGTSNLIFVESEQPTPTATATVAATPTATATATASPTPTATACGTVFWSENLDELPPGTPGPCWSISTIDPDTPPNDLFVPDSDGISDCVYDFSGITIPTATSVLRFRNNFNTEFSSGVYWDGGVLEVSAPNISGGAFLDITDSHVGGSFVTGGYTGTIDTTANNPLAGRMAWSGNSGGYIDTVINLGPSLAGQTVTLRFRFGSDNAVGAPGWRIDTIVARDGVCVTPTPTPTPTAMPTSSPTPAAQFLNLSTRLRVQAGDNVGIGGFIITGSAPKRVILRGIGPSLMGAGVPDALADPVMELHGLIGFMTIINDNWRDTQEAEIMATGLAPTNNLESAIVVTLNPGPYTAILQGKNNTSGVALVEVYDLSEAAASKLANISTRAFVSTDGDITIAGFILGGNSGNDNVILRGIGPSLTNFGVPNALANPTLELHNDNGALLIANNDWQDNPAQAAIISAAGLALTNPLESGIAATLAPGQYTAILAGLNSGTGVGLVEVYDLGSGGPSPSPGGTPTPTPSGGPSPSPTPMGPCVENWDSVTAPALPRGWVASNPDPGNGIMWVTTTVAADSAPNDAFIDDQDGISDKVLDRTGVMVTSTSPMMSFRNKFNTEMSGGIFWAGYVLEVSAPNISEGAFLDITDSHVGGSFVTGGYTGTIDTTANNPLAGRMAWSGNSGGYIDTLINLGPNLAGQTVTLRFRMGTDEVVGAPGVRIDNISITGASCP